jgi:hypothetical protein
MSAIFADHAEMLSEATSLINDDAHEDEDRVTIQSFYNGADTLSSEEAKQNGAKNVVNHLMGYDSIATAARQIESIYTKGRFMWDIELPEVPHDKIHLKGKWEASIRSHLNEVIKTSRRFKHEWKGAAGEIALFGNATLYFRDAYDWCPALTRPYVPRGATCISNELTHWAILDYMTLSDLLQAKTCHEKREEMGHESYWNIRTLNTLIEMMKGNLTENNAATLTGSSPNQTPSESLEERELNSSGAPNSKSRLPVIYFYHRSRDDQKTIDMSILPRLTPSQSKEIQDSSMAMPEYIYRHHDYLDAPEHCIHPFFVDCKLGGKVLWHKVMGLGRLNYEPDAEIEETFAELMSGARENMRRVYAIKSVADWDLLKTWASGGGPTNVLPPGVEVADMARQPNFLHAMTPMQMLMQLTRRNAATSSVQGVGAAGGTEELEVQAMERQGRNAEVLAARMSDVYECVDALGREILRRFLSDLPMETDPGYLEIKAFRDGLRKDGVPIAHLRKQVDGRLVNIKITCSRAAGDGNTVKRAMANQALMARLSLFPSQAQQLILRRVTAEETDDYDFAEQVVPYQPNRDTNQVLVATQENDTMDKQGILNYVPPLNKDDLDIDHVGEHLRSMEADLARGKVRPWDQVDLAAFMVKGSHTASHIQKMGASDANKQAAKEAQDKLQNIAKRGQEFANNMNKQNEAASQPMSQKDQVEAQLKGEALKLKARQQVKLEEHRAAAMQLSREKAALQGNLSASSSAVQEAQFFHKKNLDMQQFELDKQAAEDERQAMLTEQTQNEQQPTE